MSSPVTEGSAKKQPPRDRVSDVTLLTRYTYDHANFQSETKQPTASGQTSAQDESEDDTYGGQRGRTFAKKHRKRLQAVASGGGTPDLSEVRFSSRRAAKVANYNEDDGLNLSEEDTENLTPAYWTYEDTGPAIDQVLNHRLKEGAGM